MAQALTAACLLVAAGDLFLLLACWKRRSVLSGVLAAAGLPLVAFAILSGLRRTASKYALLIALLALVVATALYAIGQALERLLDEGPGDED